MKRKITRVIDVTVIRCKLRNICGRVVEREIEFPRAFGTYRAAEKELRGRLDADCELVSMDILYEKKVRCSMFIDSFYSCAFKEEV